DATWCGTDIGVYCIQNEKETYLPYITPLGVINIHSIKRIFKGSNKSIYATSNSNLLQVEKKENDFQVNVRLFPYRRTFAGVEFKKGEFLISGMTGLIKYSLTGNEAEYPTDVDFSSTRILDMKLDS